MVPLVVLAAIRRLHPARAMQVASYVWAVSHDKAKP